MSREKYGLRRYIRFDSLVDRAHWDDSEYRWHVFTTDGQEYVAQFLISGAGALHIPLIPDIEGKDEFRGVSFHSAQWDHNVDLTGKRVAVIGTGASAIQIVPSIVKDVGELQLYQRTPPWVVPRPNKPFPEALKNAFAYVPGLRLAVRSGIYWGLEGLGFAMTRRPALLRAVELVGKFNIRRSVKDKELRRRLTPTYRAGCKRILYSPDYYEGVANPKCHLITDRITRITPDGIVTADGAEHKVDVIVYATGFHVTDSYTYVDIKGAGGEDLVDRWNREGVVAHRGVAVADMPNLFFLLGPNTGLGHTSVVFMIEAQVRYVAQAIAARRQVRRAGAGADAKRPGPRQRRTAGRACAHRLEHRRVPQLVSGRARRQPGAVERNDLGVLARHAQAQAVRVQVSRGRSARSGGLAAINRARHTMLCCQSLSPPRGSVCVGL